MVEVEGRENEDRRLKNFGKNRERKTKRDPPSNRSISAFI
jgi:hypothetical protein